MYLRKRAVLQYTFLVLMAFLTIIHVFWYECVSESDKNK